MAFPVRSGRGTVAVLAMSEPAHREAHAEAPTPAAVAQLLDVVAADRVDHALTDIERLIARLRADAAAAAAARSVLGATPAPVIREALRLRASRVNAVADESEQSGAIRSEALESETVRSETVRCETLRSGSAVLETT